MAENSGKTVKQRFAELVRLVGKREAIFYLCAALDKAYDENLVSECESWNDYASQTDRPFADGAVNILDVFSDDKAQTARWARDWGDGNDERPYTERDYRRLDALFATMTGQLVNLGGLDKQQEDTARLCAHMALRREKLIASPQKADIDMAAKLDKMIRENLADCNMRKKDMTISQQQRLDGFVEALKSKFGVGADLTLDEAMEIFRIWLTEKQYPQTLDAEEHVILSILNTMQTNNGDGDALLTELPMYASLKNYAAQFAVNPNEAEEAAYRYLQIARDTAAKKPEATE